MNVVQAINDFQLYNFILKECNASFISLIPKIDNSISLHEYRPISLVGCIYKIIAKILSNRLELVLPCLIDNNKPTFTKGRGLLDSVVVANEFIEEVRNYRKQCLIVKLDFDKAYDSLSQDFLYYILDTRGFGTKWLSWIKACLESPTISILINGSPTQEFILARG